ncbi:MAG: metallopeptidase family protein [Lawsonibacter sp.]|nr:metallopeptidase family protein [Lawsonibacter sp.]
MVPTYNQMGDWLEEIARKFPEAFFEDLDGGIQLEERALPDPDFPPDEMYIMGEYVHDNLGRYILLYYGSFAALMSDEDEEAWREEIFATVAHEFTHHLEETAGLHALDDKDLEFLRQALEEYGGESPSDLDE